MRLMLCTILALCGLVAMGQQPLVYTNLVTDVSPQLRASRAFVPVRAISETFGAVVSWLETTQTVVIARADEPTIRMTIGSRTATVDNRTLTLDAAPFIMLGRTMVPLRFISEIYEIPVDYHPATRTVRLDWQERRYILPLESARAGVEIATPAENATVTSPVLIQGVANVFEGALTVEIRNAAGTVLGRGIATAGMGGFYAFSVGVPYTLAAAEPVDGRIVVFSINGRGDGQVLAEDSVRVRLTPTGP